MLTFLDSTKDYKLYDEQNRVVTTQKGTELYTHYDKDVYKRQIPCSKSWTSYSSLISNVARFE